MIPCTKLHFNLFHTEILITQGNQKSPKSLSGMLESVFSLVHWAGYGLSQGLLDGSKIENSKRSVYAPKYDEYAPKYDQYASAFD